MVVCGANDRTVPRLRRPRFEDGFDRLFAVAHEGDGGFAVTAMDEETSRNGS